MPDGNVNGGGLGGGTGERGRQRQLPAAAARASGANFNTTSFSVTGVDIGDGELGPISSGTLSSGRTFTTADSNADVALVDAPYATPNKLKPVHHRGRQQQRQATNFTVVGIVTEPAGDSPSDVYIPLAIAQTLAT